MLALASAVLTVVTGVAEDRIVWYEKDALPLEGKAFADTPLFFSRLPKSAENRVPEKVWRQARQSTGLLIRFRTDATRILLRWKIENEHPSDYFIPEAGLSGLDVYACHRHLGWRFRQTLRYWTRRDGKAVAGEASIDWNPKEPGMIYLPMRAVTLDFKVGVPEGCTLEAFPHEKDRTRPVVHYGTSIVHGGCVSAHGLSFTAQTGRALDVPYVNLGFSGAARMEPEMADLLASADAALYVIDCVWNMDEKMIAERTAPFLERLKSLKPDVPILLAEGCNSKEDRLPCNEALYAVYERLKSSDPGKWAKLGYLQEEKLLQHGDDRQTHDFIHPNDLGAARMAQGFIDAEAELLRIRPRFRAPGSAHVATERLVHYGPHPKQVLSFYRASGPGAHPVYVFIHGGGWLGGDGVLEAETGRLDGTIERCLALGISVAVVNYRIRRKLPDPVYDAARAIQYLRFRARDWGIDKSRIAAGGFSAGATTSLWLACHPDLADPGSSDPVCRESSRLNAAVCRGTQASIDPPEVRAWGLGKAIDAHPMIRCAGGFSSVREMDENYASVKDLYREFSSSNFVGPDTPPVLIHGDDLASTDWIHHTLFADNFCRIAREKGAKNVVYAERGKPSRYRSDLEFLQEAFGVRP